MSGAQKCDPQCRDFNCSRRNLRLQSGRPWCEWTSEPCEPKSCTYALCQRRQLLENGICGKTMKRRTREDSGPEDFIEDEILVKGKPMRRFKDRDMDIF